MSETAWMILAIVGTCLFIFVGSILLAPFILRLRRRQGIDTRPEIPLRKQAVSLGLICIGSAIASSLLAIADGNAVLYVLAAAVFIAMMAVVIKRMMRDGRHAQRDHAVNREAPSAFGR
jgi:H+/gluconate symporter-like permease